MGGQTGYEAEQETGALMGLLSISDGKTIDMIAQAAARVLNRTVDWTILLL